MQVGRARAAARGTWCRCPAPRQHLGSLRGQLGRERQVGNRTERGSTERHVVDFGDVAQAERVGIERKHAADIRKEVAKRKPQEADRRHPGIGSRNPREGVGRLDEPHLQRRAPEAFEAAQRRIIGSVIDEMKDVAALGRRMREQRSRHTAVGST